MLWFSQDSCELGKVCYLTIQESFVESGATQRRPGVHVDCPGVIRLKAAASSSSSEADGGSPKEGDGTSTRYLSHPWGLGGCHFVPLQPHHEGLDGDMVGGMIKG